jgi:HlyD family secretion protein
MIRWLIGLVIVAALGVSAVTWWRRGGAPGERVATFTVASTKFVRHVTAEGNLRALKATGITAPHTPGSRGALKLAWLAADGINVKAGDVVVRFDPSEPEKQLRDGQADLAAANTKLHEETVKSQAAVVGRDTDAELAGDELDQTRRLQAKDQTIFSRNTIIESEIDEHLAGARQDHAEQAKQIERRRSHSNTAVIGVEQQKAQLAINHASSALEGMAITAPHDGIFVLHRDWRGAVSKLGEALWPGQRVAEIPLLDVMEAEVFVLEIDGSGLAEGQPAQIAIEAHPDVSYAGKIRLVDKLAQPRQNGSPVQYFGVVIALDATDRATMKPGQRVRATLVLDQEDAIVVPRQAVFEKDGKPIVYKRGATGFSATAVDLGVASAGRVVVKKGLAAGDEIALRDPTRTLDALGSAGSATAAGVAK